MPNEKITDFIIGNLLKSAGINFFPNGSDIFEIQNALSTSSKHGTNRRGFPEFTAVANDFVIVIEDKAETKFQAKYFDEKTLLMDTESIINFAENGALHYALKIIQNSHFKKIIAFGCSGTDEKKILIRPIFVSPTGYRILDKVKNFISFSPQNIEKYYREIICQNESLEKVELKDILNRAENLHENLRNYGQLGDTEKPLVVSAILLALAENDFSTENLIGDKVKTDGEKIFAALSTHMDRVEVSPQTKKSKVLDQFRLIVNRPHLSDTNKNLGKSPLKFFAEYLNSNILTAIVNNSPEDVLGRFYGEFIRYSGGDGQTLGVVLTPKHITELFCDLVKIQPSDKVFDPCCGTGGFLISAMNKMLALAKNDEEKIFIKKNNLHGIELRDDMFSIATTNMILRGDGKSNLICADFLNIPVETLREKNFTVGLMNPPYSQAKNKSTQHLSELKFVSHLLDSLGENARCVVIVPQSTMVGKTSEDKSDKKYILENHTLEGVITLNPQTFYGVGTNPVIAVFTAHKPHDKNKLVKFVDFKNDGYEVFPHLGLLPTKDAPERKKFLLRCWHEGMTAPTSFIIRTEIKTDDEWLHSFYYFNEEIPTESDFEKTMADYLTFEFNMIVHGRGYLFDGEKKNSPLTEENLSLENKTWKDFCIKDLFKTKKNFKQVPTGAYVTKENLIFGKTPRITVTALNNGIFDFYSSSDENYRLQKNFISVSFLGDAFYHNYTASLDMKVHCLQLKNFSLNRYVALFLIQTLKQMTKNFNYGDQLSSTDIVNKKILLPVNESGEPDYFFMENFMRSIENRLLILYKNYLEQKISAEKIFVDPLSEKKFGTFTIGEIFSLEPGKGKGNNHLESVENGISYLGATNRNNAVLDFVKPVEKMIQRGNCIAFIRNGEGSMGYAVYKRENFIASADITVGYSPHLNEYTGKFLTTVADMVRGKYNFNYKRSDTRLKKEKIKLPVDEKNLPDWEYMEKYMRSKENELLKKYFERKLI